MIADFLLFFQAEKIFLANINTVNYICDIIIINTINNMKGVKVGNKEIQEQRMRGYFIQAAKEILKGEGLRNISVRNIADRAGYSYATLYNYFKDANELIFECVHDFLEECRHFIRKETEGVARGCTMIRAINLAYMKFFIQYPGIYELFYIERMNDFVGKKPTTEMIYNFVDTLSSSEWDYCVRERNMTPGVAAIRKEQMKYTVAGILLYYMNRRQPSSYAEFMKISNEQIESILEF